MVLFENGIKSNMFKMALLIVTILSVFLLIEYYAIYKMNVIDAIRFQNDTKGIEVKPFHTFLMLNNGSWIKLILNFTTSLFLPIGCLIVFFKQIRNNNIAKFTYLIFLFSLLIGIMISEKGVMANNGNFIWQVYVSNYLLFLVMIKFAYEQIIAIGWRNKKSLIVMFIFAMHVISGFLYLAKIFYLRKYT
jgi:hypothetical protein